MCEGDDRIPDDEGPKVRLRRPAFEPAPRGGRCLECPKHDAARAWCPVKAETRPGRSPMCRYGAALLRKARKDAT